MGCRGQASGFFREESDLDPSLRAPKFPKLGVALRFLGGHGRRLLGQNLMGMIGSDGMGQCNRARLTAEFYAKSHCSHIIECDECVGHAQAGCSKHGGNG